MRMVNVYDKGWHFLMCYWIGGRFAETKSEGFTWIEKGLYHKIM